MIYGYKTFCWCSQLGPIEYQIHVAYYVYCKTSHRWRKTNLLFLFRCIKNVPKLIYAQCINMMLICLAILCQLISIPLYPIIKLLSSMSLTIFIYSVSFSKSNSKKYFAHWGWTWSNRIQNWTWFPFESLNGH